MTARKAKWVDVLDESEQKQPFCRRTFELHCLLPLLQEYDTVTLGITSQNLKEDSITRNFVLTKYMVLKAVT